MAGRRGVEEEDASTLQLGPGMRHALVLRTLVLLTSWLSTHANSQISRGQNAS